MKIKMSENNKHYLVRRPETNFCYFSINVAFSPSLWTHGFGTTVHKNADIEN